MRFFRLLSLIVIVGLSPAAWSAPQPAPPINPVAPPPGSLPQNVRIAIANPSRIFNEMKETKKLRDDLEDRRKALQGKELEKRQAIDALIADRNNYLPTHPKYREMCDRIDVAKADLQGWGMATKASVERDQKAMVKDLYDKIEKAVAEVAQQNNIDLVLTDGRQDIPNLEDVPTEELRRLLNSRNVLYSNRNVDISERVITVLDAKYTADKK